MTSDLHEGEWLCNGSKQRVGSDSEAIVFSEKY
jgi:hypothetical protein